MKQRRCTTGFLLVALLAVVVLVRLPVTSAQAPAPLGMVSSAHPVATEAGLEILRAGGNAFDAAVAIAATLNVVEPMMSGIGGYGTIMVYDAKSKRARFLNCSGRIPKSLDSDVFRAPAPNWRENRTGAKAVSTPGNLNCLEAMSKEYGALPWKRLFDPAIRAAEGHTLNANVARAIAAAFKEFPPHTQAFYGKNGQPLADGDQLVQKDLAASFRKIAQHGAKVLHGGELGAAIDRAMREQGSFLTLADLRDNKAEWWEPIRINYRGHQVVTSSPPANSFDMLVRLGMMSRLDAAKLGHNSGDYLHWFAEITKHGFWVRLRHASDPDVAPVPLAELFSEKYWTARIAEIDAQRAKPFVPPGANRAAATSHSDSELALQSHTTHFVVADKWGNVVSATQTLGNLFGSRLMAPGTGIWLNNSLAYSTFEPKGNTMEAFPGRHKLSGDCPTLIFRDGRVWAALGTPGGHTIGQTVPQIVMNLIDFKMDMTQAIAAPRISFNEPDDLLVENAIPAAVFDALAARGHRTRRAQALGNATGLTIEYDAQGKPARFHGAADPRGAGTAKSN